MMRENTTFDNLIKKKLDELNSEPPDYMWDRIQASISPVSSKTGFNLGKLLLKISAALLFIILITVGWIYFSNNNFEKNHQSTAQDATTKQFAGEADKLTQADQSKKKSDFNTVESNNDYANKPISQPQSQNIEKSSEITNLSSQPKPIRLDNLKVSGTVVSEENLKLSETKINIGLSNEIQISESNQSTKEQNKNAEIKQISENPPIITTPEISKVEQPVSTKTDSIVKPSTIIPENKVSKNNEIFPVIANPEKPETIKKSELPDLNVYQIGLHYGAYNMYNTDNHNPAQIPTISFSYSNLNFIFKTGLSVMYSYEESSYTMYYNTRKFDLKQNITQDMEPYWDPVIQNYRPTLTQYTTEDVYKNVNDSFISKARDNYYNFRIPVLIGYKKQFAKFGYAAFAGVAINQQIVKQTKGLKELDNNSKLTQLYYPIKQRRATNLEYILAANLSYEFLPKLSAQFEIQSSFMQKSIYLNTSNNNSISWFAGFSAGLLYTF